MEKRCSLIKLLWIWLIIGTTSFGGGSITHYLIQEYFIYKEKLITPDEYVNIMALCQVTPGMSIIAITILVGKLLHGYMGIFISLLGILTPSIALTVLLSMVYIEYSQLEATQHILKAVFASIFGVALTTNLRNATPVFKRNKARSRMAWSFVVFASICIGLFYILLKPNVVYMYILGAIMFAVFYTYQSTLKVSGSERRHK